MPGNSTASWLSNIIACLQQNELTLSGVIQGVLKSNKPSHKTARELLLRNAQRICTVLHKQSAAHQSVFSWAFGLVSGVLCKKVEELSQEQHDLHFKANTATTEQLDNTFLLLKGPNDRHVKLRQNNDEMLVGFAPLVENDLGKLGGTKELARDSEHDEESPMKKSQKQAGARNAALLMILEMVICIIIFLQSLNKRCNYLQLQAILGIFYHSTSVPEKVIETLAHAGLSVSLSSIYQAIVSLSKDTSSQMKKALHSLCTAIAYNNFDIDFKTAQPTVEKSGSFVSATSATAISLFGVQDPVPLCCSAQL
ncbi:hypothetical protein SERLA73DRAFT_68739 [Serpula lacrymans var. lacrymans S7.3]|uniref:Uncharacterized protein n=2 Tax=Serpula lacrymans var. lacrymans TaxID=341189 RepID=F8PI01_SERL3|nr:uncharacterized protein SERLADRAFT_432503 [Serpula lacrymans var. lacrymans S7.9]EGO05097.1 hypothetical protein SERLA73DRAFT_68739 [Serpula lacrymans var. lacrymans S7.3]EGO30863.1 hypothetical protein SERLADRAFT_432503 [Serpula lacrymans var. lacrymans S7.9]